MILKMGDFFGERALLTSDLRSATVRADTTLTVLELSREQFDAMGLREDKAPEGKDVTKMGKRIGKRWEDWRKTIGHLGKTLENDWKSEEKYWGI